jgi:uncharacterized protein (DUF2236 family)
VNASTWAEVTYWGGAQAAGPPSPPHRRGTLDRVTDTGLFGPGSVTWKVHAEPILWVAGLRALFLQALQPRAIAGLSQNSDYKTDPWRRLERTARYVGTVIYGSVADAEAAAGRVRALHARMRATDLRTGETFQLDEPELLLWVHVTEVESFLDTARRAGLKLTDEQADGYYAEQRRAAALVGLDPREVPASCAEVTLYYERIQPRLAMTKEAAEALLFLAVPPMPWGLGLTPVRGAYLGVAALAIALLPAWARRRYGLPALPTTGPVASLSARALRLGLAALPRRMYEGPQYQSAMRRIRGQQSTDDHGSRAGAAAIPGGHSRR